MLSFIIMQRLCNALYRVRTRTTEYWMQMQREIELRFAVSTRGLDGDRNWTLYPNVVKHQQKTSQLCLRLSLFALRSALCVAFYLFALHATRVCLKTAGHHRTLQDTIAMTAGHPNEQRWPPDYVINMLFVYFQYIKVARNDQQITKCQVRWTTDIAYLYEFSVKAYGDYRERGQVLSCGNTIHRPISLQHAVATLIHRWQYKVALNNATKSRAVYWILFSKRCKYN